MFNGVPCLFCFSYCTHAFQQYALSLSPPLPVPLSPSHLLFIICLAKIEIFVLGIFSEGMGKKWIKLSPGYSARLRAGPSALPRTSSFSSAAAGKAGGAPPLPQLSEADKTLPIYTWPHKKVCFHSPSDKHMLS